MATDPGKKKRAPSEARALVEDAGTARPFMRGIMVHSLMARGIDFEKALETAEAVRQRITGQGRVERTELAKMVREILGADVLAEHQPPLPQLPGRILVTSKDLTPVPFSKGILSQSLLAAAIEPDDAFGVAEEIQGALVLSGIQSVARRELRERATDALVERFGQQTADRYLLWRRHQEPEKPIILLLGGTTGCGKTTLALEVAQRLGIGRVASTDSIRQILRIILTPELVPSLHASSFEGRLGAAPIDDDDDPVLAAFHAQAGVVSVGIRAMIERAIEENASLIIDGVSLVPGQIDLEAYRDDAHVIFLTVARLDEDAFRNHFRSREQRQKRRGAQRYVENLEAILKIQEEFLELADRYDVPIVDNVTLEGSVLLVIRHVIESLRRQGELPLSQPA